MSDLKIRRIPFKFEGVDFIWNQDDPAFAITMNKVSFFAIGFEKYICQAMRDAEPLMKDPRVVEEARDFRSQESIHSMAHRKHAKALIARYPGLQAALDKSIELFDKLYDEKDLKYHLAYVGGLESIFTPSFRLMLDNREALFSKGDTRVASLFLWHFCEEIEHRSSGIMVYDHVYGNYLYRIKRFRGFMRHVGEVIEAITNVFREVFPDLPAAYFTDYSNHKLPLAGKLRSALGIAVSQLPWHNPVHQALPEYFHEWSARFDRGEDMTRTYGVGAQHGQAGAAQELELNVGET
jgi:predicted metal-dependent hydrolase